MLIILSGSIGRSVTGGQAWANLQYLIGLRELGHDVYYVEDCGDWSIVYDWESQEKTWELDYPANYIQICLTPHGFGERWLYRAGEDSRGMELAQFNEVCRQADLLLIRGIPMLRWRDEYDLPRRRAFIDVDPGFTQFCYARGEPAYIENIDKCESLFSVGQMIGKTRCAIPTLERQWQHTASPIALSSWDFAYGGDKTDFTSVIRWRGMKDMTHEGVKYGQRNREFNKFLELPSRTRQKLSIALTGGGTDVLHNHGWHTVEGWKVSKTPGLYQRYIQNSRAEFGVAKNTYVDTRSGWFSDRSACYLASGRPVLVQDTGIGDWLNVGDGVLTFRNLDEAVTGIECINEDYEHHQNCARQLAVEVFSTDVQLPRLLEMALN